MVHTQASHTKFPILSLFNHFVQCRWFVAVLCINWLVCEHVDKRVKKLLIDVEKCSGGGGVGAGRCNFFAGGVTLIFLRIHVTGWTFAYEKTDRCVNKNNYVIFKQVPIYVLLGLRSVGDFALRHDIQRVVAVVHFVC